MHSEILTEGQAALLPLVARFKDSFGLVGGTAIALQIGHRESIDFDLFTREEFKNARIRDIVKRAGKTIDTVYANETGHFTFIIEGVQFTFFQFDYPVEYSVPFDEYARMPTLLSLAAMKAFAFGQRAKWRDYVDMYCILRHHHSLGEISERAETLFGGEFNERLFRQQLDYFDDIDYRQKVVFKPGFEVPDEEIKRALQDYSTA